LFLYGILYASEIHRNLVFILVLAKLGFNLNFHNNGVDLYLYTNYHGCCYFLDGFIILDVDYSHVNICYSLFTSFNQYDYDVNV